MDELTAKQKIKEYLKGKDDYIDAVYNAYQKADILPDGSNTTFSELFGAGVGPEPYEIGQYFSMIPALLNICEDNWIQLECSEHWGADMGQPQHIPRKKWTIDSKQFGDKAPLCSSCSGHLSFLTPHATILICRDCERLYRNQQGQISAIDPNDPEIQQLKDMRYYD